MGSIEISRQLWVSPHLRHMLIAMATVRPYASFQEHAFICIIFTELLSPCPTLTETYSQLSS